MAHRPTARQVQAAAQAASADWTRRAACTGRGLLMAPPRALHTEAAEEHAVAICFGCPVLTPCRDQVLALPEILDPGGVVAAMTEAERTDWRAGRAAPPGHKRCRRCDQARPVEDFWADVRTVDGRANTCGFCRRVMQRARHGQAAQAAGGEAL